MVRFTLWIEVRAAFTATHGQAGQAVLERLLEGEEFEHALGHAGVEANAALVGSDRVIVLHPPSALHADITLVVLPTDADTDDSVRLGDAPEDLVLVVFLLVLDVAEDVLSHFLDGLNELRLTGIALLDARDELLEVDVVCNCLLYTSPSPRD